MADDSQYDTHKRKYQLDDSSPPPPRRRPTGFSAPIPPPDSDQTASFNHANPSPLDEFQFAKQKLQELASRALNADPKRSKFDDNGGFGSNFNNHSSDLKSFSSNIQAGIPVSHSFSGSKKIEIPNGRVGVIIGKAGETIKYLQIQSGARIQITRDADHDRNLPNRTVELMGNEDQIAKAEQLINEVLAEADAGGPGSASRRLAGAAGSEQFVMKVPNNKVGLVIGKGGESIKNIQARSGARVQVIPLHPPPGDTSNERTVQMDGTSEQIEVAKQMVNEVIENRLRNPASAGSYPHQGYQTQPPMSWNPQPPQAQQTGYGYMQQPGAYPGAPSQYNMSQPPHSGYPPQPTPGGYAQNWDPSSAPQSQSGHTQGTGYDYYGQQQMPPQPQQPPSGPPTGSSGYNYNQQVGGYGQQGYSQDGYEGGYNAQVAQPGYGQPPNSQSGYDQQHGYGTTPGYGNVTNPPANVSQGETGQVPPPQQGYTGQPSPNQAYPTHGSNQAGYGSQVGYGAPSSAPGGYGPTYGAPQGQRTPPNPPSYGQSQQSPSQAGGYTQPSSGQPGYPPSQTTAQPGYGQPDSGVPQPAASYPPAYGAPPVTPPSYAQHPPTYYGGAYTQPPAYPADGNVAAPVPALAPAPAPASQPSGQPSGAAKTSPES